MPTITIGRAAKAAGVGVETIRFYERRNLIDQPPRPAGGGARDYGGDTVARLRFIGQAQEIGFSLAEIAELLSLRASSGAGCEDIRARAVAKRKTVQKKLDRLQQMREALDELISQCPGKGRLSGCTILEAMQSNAVRK
jgi:Hg(II)-responsive transcriptional regulator